MKAEGFYKNNNNNKKNRNLFLIIFGLDVEQVITPIVVVIFFLSWVFISAMVFRNLFIGVMGMYLRAII